MLMSKRYVEFMLFLAILISITIPLHSIDSANNDWSIYRGNRGLTGAVTSALPLKPILQWTFKAGDALESSPVVVNNKIVFGSKNGSLYCIDVKSGKIIWTLATSAAIDAPPIIIGQYVYVGNLAGEFLKVDINDGKVIWIFNCKHQIYAAANYWIDGNGKILLLFGAYDFIMRAVDAESGKLCWEIKTNNFVHSSGAVEIINGMVVWGGCDARLRIADINTGKQLNQIILSSYLPAAPAIKDGCVYIGSYGGELFAIDVNSCKIIWKFSNKNSGVNFVSSPAVCDMFVIIGDKNGNIYVVDRKNGQLVNRLQSDGEITGIVIASNKEILVTTMSGLIYIYDLNIMKERWKYFIGPAITVSPAVFDNKFVVSDISGNLYLFANSNNQE